MAESNLDTQEISNQIISCGERVIQEIYRQITKNRDKDAEQKLMQKFVKGNGAIKASNVKNAHFDEIREELIKKGVPFMAIPGQKDGALILVRQEYENQLLAIEEAIAMKDTALAKELSLKNGIQVLKTQGVKQTVTLSFQDKDMVEIAKQKLFQSGQTFMTMGDGDATKLVIFPSSLYKNNGRDLEYFKLNYALTQARGADMFKAEGEEESTLIQVRKEQARYDKSIVEDFIKKATAGEHVVLGDIQGNGAVYLEAKGKAIVVCDKERRSETPITYEEGDSVAVMYATLSRHTEKIQNMMTFEGDYYNEVVKDKKITFEDLDASYQNRYNRPKLKGKDLRYHYLLNTSAETLLEQINQEAMTRIKSVGRFDTLSPERKASLKHEEIIHILKDGTFEGIQTFLNDSKFDISRQEREELLENVLENFENETQNSRYSVDVETMATKDLERLYETGDKDKEVEVEQEKGDEAPTLE